MTNAKVIIIIVALSLAVGFGIGLWVGLRGQGEGSEQLAVSETRVGRLRDTVVERGETIKKLRGELVREWKNYSRLEEYTERLEAEYRTQRNLYKLLRQSIEGGLEGTHRATKLITESIELLQETTD
jgi:hypothetical protein